MRKCGNCGVNNLDDAKECKSCYSVLPEKSIYKYVSVPHNEAVSVGKWMIIIICTAIPFINLICFISLAFNSKDETLSNFGKASLLLGLIGFVIMLFVRCAA